MAISSDRLRARCDFAHMSITLVRRMASGAKALGALRALRGPEGPLFHGLSAAVVPGYAEA